MRRRREPPKTHNRHKQTHPGGGMGSQGLRGDDSIKLSVIKSNQKREFLIFASLLM